MTTTLYSEQVRLCRASQFGFAQSPVSAGISGELIPAARLLEDARALDRPRRYLGVSINAKLQRGIRIRG